MTSSVEVDEARAAFLDGVGRALPLSDVARLYAAYVLAARGGNKVHAARSLGIDRRTLQRWFSAKGGGTLVRCRAPHPQLGFRFDRTNDLRPAPSDGA